MPFWRGLSSNKGREPPELLMRTGQPAARPRRIRHLSQLNPRAGCSPSPTADPKCSCPRFSWNLGAAGNNLPGDKLTEVTVLTTEVIKQM